jgi:hypothetical protein
MSPLGTLGLFATPPAALILIFLGALLGGWWLGLIALVVLIVALALSFPVIAYIFGLEAFAKVTAIEGGGKKLLALIAGLAALMLLVRIPVLGALIALATMLFGLGALLRTGVELRKHRPAVP